MKDRMSKEEFLARFRTLPPAQKRRILATALMEMMRLGIEPSEEIRKQARGMRLPDVYRN